MEATTRIEPMCTFMQFAAVLSMTHFGDGPITWVTSSPTGLIMGPVTFNHGVEGSSPSALTKNSNKTVIFSVALAMHRVGVSAPDIAGADESNLPAPESFRSTVACFESASGPKRNGPSAGARAEADMI